MAWIGTAVSVAGTAYGAYQTDKARRDAKRQNRQGRKENYLNNLTSLLTGGGTQQFTPRDLPEHDWGQYVTTLGGAASTLNNHYNPKPTAEQLAAEKASVDGNVAILNANKGREAQQTIDALELPSSFGVGPFSFPNMQKSIPQAAQEIGVTGAMTPHEGMNKLGSLGVTLEDAESVVPEPELDFSEAIEAHTKVHNFSLDEKDKVEALALTGTPFQQAVKTVIDLREPAADAQRTLLDVLKTQALTDPDLATIAGDFSGILGDIKAGDSVEDNLKKIQGALQIAHNENRVPNKLREDVNPRDLKRAIEILSGITGDAANVGAAAEATSAENGLGLDMK